jgi:hypothetical protein
MATVCRQERPVYHRPGRPKGSRDINPRKGKLTGKIGDRRLKECILKIASSDKEDDGYQTVMEQEAVSSYEAVLKIRQMSPADFGKDTGNQKFVEIQLSSVSAAKQTEQSELLTRVSTIPQKPLFEPGDFFAPLTDPFHDDWEIW